MAPVMRDPATETNRSYVILMPMRITPFDVPRRSRTVSVTMMVMSARAPHGMSTAAQWNHCCSLRRGWTPGYRWPAGVGNLSSSGGVLRSCRSHELQNGAPRGGGRHRDRVGAARHSTISITADTYSHLIGGVGRRMADAVEGLLPSRSETPSTKS